MADLLRVFLVEGASTLLGVLGTLRAEEPSEVHLDSSLTSSKIEIYSKECQSSKIHNFLA